MLSSNIAFVCGLPGVTAIMIIDRLDRGSLTNKQVLYHVGLNTGILAYPNP